MQKTNIRSTLVSVLLVLTIHFNLHSGAPYTSDDLGKYTSYVKECLDILMEHGVDRYGEVHAPMLVSILDVETRTCPSTPKKLDEYFRVTRRDRRSPGGSNLLTDQPTLKAMYALTNLTGNSDYAAFADHYSSYVLKHLVDDQRFFWWGWHRHYDVFKDSREGHNPNMAKWGKKVIPHEIHAINGIAWDRLWAVGKDAVTKEIEAIWKWHVIDKESGEINRHGDGNKGCDFSMSGGAFIEAFAFMYSQTKDQQWLNRARLIAEYYWKRKNPKTHLLPERPNAGKKRFDGSSFVTSITGLYCHSLLKAYDITEEASFRDHALAYLKAYAKFGYDENSGKFWGALQMDGTPIPGPRIYTENIDSEDGYAAAQPRGHLDLWEPYVAGYQYPIYTAQAYAYAYHLTGDPDMLEAAKRFASWINKTSPGTIESEHTWYSSYSEGPGRKGTYAGKYGRTISFLLHLHVITGEHKHLGSARALADTAIGKLYHNGLFRGHPAKPYYEAMDGVGYLLYALLQLDHVLDDPKAVVAQKNSIATTASQETVIDLDNW
ncbi:MAG: hypothetical protein HKN87_11720 [Saprospiraceae bacterium]|nr:hypothetical protein [Saprospiraceae bacterium]